MNAAVRKILFCSIVTTLVGAGSLFAQQTVTAKLVSPDEFLGYKTGTRFTPHWKIISYFQAVAAAAPALVKMENYGETNEGRPLVAAFVSSAENISNLDFIRRNNLRLANYSRDKAAAVEAGAPAIVWLSYNVHGNETSSSEAAMLTLWALVNPAETKTKAWLNNTVVVIDPCINPDGRDRYVNWYNSVAGSVANPQLIAREHREPWPGGRTNHYNFDLNRDWAWQTQKESRQRMLLYRRWLPQVHVDFHEQGVNDPYYFAPAAQPYHDVITPWQRSFQETIGRNHAKYFDENGWLYFTKEIFDLYYPSYGDTYPIYNGAIGMTYEQGGGPSGGAAAINDEGDTLTLMDRVLHHYTTGLSTIEVASLHAAKLISEYRNYFNESVRNGLGEYKSYIIRNSARDRDRIAALLELLDKNGIAYTGVSGSGKGFNYTTGKEESFSLNNDILVSALQPASALVRVFFEPRARLADSLTYDITAWALPYAYGVDAWASRDRLSGNGTFNLPVISNRETSYGYVIPWKGLPAVQFAAALLKKGILLRYAEQPFEVNGNSFDRGSLLLLKTANRNYNGDLFADARQAANNFGVQLYPVSTGFVDKGNDFGSDKMHPFRAPRVVLLTGEGVNSNAAGEVWHFFDQQLHYPVTLVNTRDAGSVNWNNTDVLIMPDGNYGMLGDKNQLDALKAWVSKGGKIVALESAVSALAKVEMGLKQRKNDDGDKKDDKSGYDLLKKYEDRERQYVSSGTPGAVLRVELDNTHPLAFGYPSGIYFTLKMDDNLYEFFNSDGWNAGVIKKDNQVSGFVGAKLKERLNDGLIFGVQQYGNGTIVGLSDNVLFRNFWENGKLLFCNAVFLAGQ